MQDCWLLILEANFVAISDFETFLPHTIIPELVCNINTMHQVAFFT